MAVVLPRSRVGASLSDWTSPCVEAARGAVEAAGHEVQAYPATGHGGRTLEADVRGGLLAGVLDLTTTELADELVGGIQSAGPDRLTAAALRGVPQVLSVGGLDLVRFEVERVPERYRGRRLQTQGALTLMRTTPEENDTLGKEMAHKASAARGPTALLLPLRGLSTLDRVGEPFWWPEADATLFQSLRNWMSPHVRLLELDLHLNDPAFAAEAARVLLEMMRE
jgi:uncharacterized protein (UPF0261 family)